jgi:hypothetical protein
MKQNTRTYFPISNVAKEINFLGQFKSQFQDKLDQHKNVFSLFCKRQNMFQMVKNMTEKKVPMLSGLNNLMSQAINSE